MVLWLHRELRLSRLLPAAGAGLPWSGCRGRPRRLAVPGASAHLARLVGAQPLPAAQRRCLEPAGPARRCPVEEAWRIGGVFATDCLRAAACFPERGPCFLPRVCLHVLVGPSAALSQPLCMFLHCQRAALSGKLPLAQALEDLACLFWFLKLLTRSSAELRWGSERCLDTQCLRPGPVACQRRKLKSGSLSKMHFFPTSTFVSD